ncbi:MAG: hypothetical protein WC384_06315 [Prolixibacteraceae bacterium]|jgi:hypothetical protein
MNLKALIFLSLSFFLLIFKPLFADQPIKHRHNQESAVQINIYNLQRKYPETIFDGQPGSGTQYQPWTPAYLENGMYLYKILTFDKPFSGKMVYIY